MTHSPIDVATARPTRARLNLLRDFELHLGDAPVEVPPTSQRLIGFLALHPGHFVRRTYVSGSLWPDATESRAFASLRSAIWRCPEVGGEPLVVASTTHLRLHPDVEVDLVEVSQRGHRRLASRTLDACTQEIAADLHAFSYDLLVDWYDEWVVVERERFRQLRLHVLEQIGDLLLGANDLSTALEFGLVAVSSEPLRESAHRLLVRAHLREGNVGEAVRQYRAYSDLLSRELHAKPSAAMERLVSESISTAAKPSWGSAPT